MLTELVRSADVVKTPRDRDPGHVVVVGAPVEFDSDVDYELRPAPEHGADTEEILLELGKSWDEISDLKAAGAVL